MIAKKELVIGHKVLLYNSRLKLILEKLQSRCEGPFVVTNVFHYGAVEIQDVTSKRIFKVNGYRLKHFQEDIQEHVMEEVALLDATYSD